MTLHPDLAKLLNGVDDGDADAVIVLGERALTAFALAVWRNGYITGAEDFDLHALRIEILQKLDKTLPAWSEKDPPNPFRWYGRKCTECEKGIYGEQSIHNDWEGTVTCSVCGHTVQNRAHA